MNWLDIIFIVILAVAAYMGMKNGLLSTAFTAVGVYIGWLLAGQYSGDLGEVFSDKVDNQTWVTVISYGIIIIMAVVVTRIIWRIVRPILTILTLGLSGMVDKLGGLAMGLIVGAAILGLVIIGMARFTYSFELPSEGIAGSVAGRIPDLESKREKLEEALYESAIASTIIDLIDKMPVSAFGLIPDDFGAAVDILQEAIDELDAAKETLGIDETS